MTNDVFLFVLAVAAERFGILVHTYCVLSNHFHVVVTDPHARLPAFEQYLDSLVARALNASLGRWEAFWAPSSYSAVSLPTPEDSLAKCAYVLANPAAAGLVRRGRDWPGVWSDPGTVGLAAVEVRRPTVFFRANGRMPETARLELTPPPGFESASNFRSRLASAVAELEEAAAAGGRAFLGRRRVLSQEPTARPEAEETRRTLNPRVAGRDRWRRVEALGRLAAFLEAYREAWELFRKGARDVVFPAGTYGLRISQGVCCAAP